MLCDVSICITFDWNGAPRRLKSLTEVVNMLSLSPPDVTLDVFLLHPTGAGVDLRKGKRMSLSAGCVLSPFFCDSVELSAVCVLVIGSRIEQVLEAKAW